MNYVPMHVKSVLLIYHITRSEILVLALTLGLGVQVVYKKESLYGKAHNKQLPVKILVNQWCMHNLVRKTHFHFIFQSITPIIKYFTHVMHFPWIIARN